MATPTYEDVLKLARALTLDDRLRLIATLAMDARAAGQTAAGSAWLDLLGTAPYPALGEDAQTWVTRMRREWDDREGRLRERS